MIFKQSLQFPYKGWNSGSLISASVVLSSDLLEILCTVCTWRCTALRSLNCLPHSLQAKKIPEWVTKCRLRPDIWWKLRGQRWHLWERSLPKCTRLMCWCRFDFWAKQLEQWGHLWRLAPVCVSMCRFRTSRWEKDWSHSSHLNGFTPVWMIMWRLRELEQDSCNSQMGHFRVPPLPLFKPLTCVFIWRVNILSVAKATGHNWHWNVFTVSDTLPALGWPSRGDCLNTRSFVRFLFAGCGSSLDLSLAWNPHYSVMI